MTSYSWAPAYLFVRGGTIPHNNHAHQALSVQEKEEFIDLKKYLVLMKNITAATEKNNPQIFTYSIDVCIYF